MPFTPFGRAGDARQHQVDDVLGHVVLAVGDEDLGAEDLVAAVGLRLGARAHQRQVAAGLRLGQVHRAGPLAGDHLREVGLLQLGEPAVSSASIAPSVSSGHSAKLRLALLSISMQAAPMVLGRPWPPNSAGCCRPCQPPSPNWRNASLKPGVVRDLAVLPRRRVGVASHVQRRHHLLVEARAFLEHGLRGVEPGFLEAGQLGHGLEAGQFLHHEQHVLDRCAVAHGATSRTSASAARRGAR